LKVISLPPLPGRLAKAEEAAAMEKRLSTDKNDQIRALSEKLQVLAKKFGFLF
jgi:hypothetical protein